jgi:hypothetical protein
MLNHGGTVISIVLPINEKVRKSNAAQEVWPSKEWALLRSFGDEIFLKRFHKHLVNYLNQMGHRTLDLIARSGSKFIAQIQDQLPIGQSGTLLMRPDLELFQ